MASEAVVSGGYGPRSIVRRVARVVLILISVIGIGTAGYMIIEGWNFSDAIYQTVITISTVGFTEVEKVNGIGRVWTMFIILSGIVTFGYATSYLVEVAVEGTVRGYFARRRLKAEIDRLNGHYVLCGYGRVGRQVAAEFQKDNVAFVIIDQDPGSVEECLDAGYLALLGEASDDVVLREAGLSRAKGLVAAVDSDADNVFVVLSARKLNPKLHIVARASSDASASKLEIAGADRTLSPYAVGGRRLASLATQPLIIDFLDVVTRGEQGIEFRLEEFEVPEDSAIADHTIGELRIGERTGAIVLAFRTSDGKFDTTPAAEDRLHAGDILIVLGSGEQIERLDQLMRGHRITEE